MEEIKETLGKFSKTLNSFITAVNLVTKENKKLGDRLVTLEGDYENRNAVGIQLTPLTKARNEYELKEASTLPDCVKELQVFEGQPESYVSWISRAQSILNEYQVIKNKHIKSKICGNADTSLLAYGVPNDDWEEIKRIFSLKYADKKDLRTLEHQLNRLNQVPQSLKKFNTEVNNQFSLILSNLRNGNREPVVVDALIETYRDKALDVFIGGVNGDFARWLLVRNPRNLPEAYSFCLELQNVVSRAGAGPTFVSTRFSQPSQYHQPIFLGTYQGYGRPPLENFHAHSNQHGPRAVQPSSRWTRQRALKMEFNRSGQSHHSGYNGPPNDSTIHKRPATGHINPFQKAQRLYHIEPTPALPAGGEERNDRNGHSSAFFKQVLNPEGSEH